MPIEALAEVVHRGMAEIFGNGGDSVTVSGKYECSECGTVGTLLRGKPSRPITTRKNPGRSTLRIRRVARSQSNPLGFYPLLTWQRAGLTRETHCKTVDRQLSPVKMVGKKSWIAAGRIRPERR
jgi:hypothetical protein